MQLDAIRDARATLASLPIYAQGLAGFKKDVRVVFDPRVSTACTDGRTIRLPPLPLPQSTKDLERAQRLAVLVYGFLPHEVGHIRHSDFEVIGKAKAISPLCGSLLNGIEDPRQELELIQEFPGTRRHLDELARAVIGQEGFYQVLTENDPPSWLITAYAMYLMRGLVRDQPEFTDLAEASRPSLVSTFGEGFTSRLDVLLHTQGPKLCSTQDAFDLSQRILAAMEESAEPPPPPPSADDEADEADSSDQSNGDEQGQGNSGQDDGEPDGQQADDGDDGADGADQSGGPSDDAADSGSDGAGDDSGSPDASSPDTTDANRSALKQALSASEDDAMLEDLGDQLGREIGEIAEQDNDKPTLQDDGEVCNTPTDEHRDPLLGGTFDRDGSMQQSGRLRALLRNEFQALQLEREHEGTRGAFNQRRAFRTSQGDRRVFRSIDERPGLNTAVFLLEDISGSMSGGKLQLGAQALYATAVALNGLSGVDCAIGTFPQFAMVLKFGQKAMAFERNFALRPTGSTPMAEGLLWASRKLMAMPHQRKILLTITDGEPDNFITAQAQIDALEKAGVEMMGLGVKCSSVERLFRRSAVIHDINEISGAMLEIVGTTLRRQLAAA